MSLLKEIVKEMAVTGAAAATGGNAIAGTRGSLFGGGIVDPEHAKKKQRKMMRRRMNIKEAIAPKSEETNFDASGVISKIDAAEKRARANDDTTAFGLEDEEGQIVKVYVSNDQAEDFEKALAIALAGEDSDDDDENTSMEIAEVLFKLKDRFEIVDVEWDNFEGDEDEEQEIEDGDGDDLALGNEEGDELDPDSEGDIESDITSDETEGDGEATSALQSVIDVMKADAEAKMAEAKAKEAEANAKEAEYAAQSASTKVQQEEQILDMETHNKAESDKKKEAQTLAKLAKYKHETTGSTDDALPDTPSDNQTTSDGAIEMEEEENGSAASISIEDLSALIMKNLRAN